MNMPSENNFLGNPADASISQLNVSIHHTSGQIIRRSIKDFGSRMVSEARNELVSLLSTHDYDDLASVILENASDSFLDQALEKRLRTIEARPLINALANAGRLGYDPSDIIEQDSKSERVIPGQPAGHPSGCTSDGRWNCTMCGRFFPAESAYKHHVNKKVCEKEPPNAKGFSHSCTYCGQCFTTIVGLQYVSCLWFSSCGRTMLTLARSTTRIRFVETLARRQSL